MSPVKRVHNFNAGPSVLPVPVLEKAQEEMLAQEKRLAPIQESMIQEGGVQCGFCTPGILISSRALLDRQPDPTEDEIRQALVGNLCRCTGYIRIVDAVKDAASRQQAMAA